MLITESDVNVAVPAPVEQLGESGALLRENRKARMPEVMEFKPGDAGILARSLPGPTEGIRVKR